MLNKDQMNLWLILILILGALVRVLPVVTADFPINDGGLFLTMTADLVQNSFKVPLITTYNGSRLPYAYPPLAFYLLGLLHTVGRISLFSLIHYSGAVLACLSLLPFYFLARSLLGRDKAVWALGVYALMPAGYQRLIAGGGVTRSLGMVFALGSLFIAVASVTQKRKTGFFWGGILWGFAILSHPEAGIFAGVGLALLLIYGLKETGTFVKTAVVAGAISAVWWGRVIPIYGIQPLIAALNANMISSGSWKLAWFLYFTDEPMITVSAILAGVGVIYFLIRRKYLLPVWFILMFLVFRRGPQIAAAVPASLLAGEMLEVIFNSIKGKENKLAGVVASFLMVGYVTGTMVGNPAKPYVIFNTLSKRDRIAMEWVHKNTPTDSRFVVLTEKPTALWGSDSVSEWFPVLSGRTSILTIQGNEWVPNKPVTIYKWRTEIDNCLGENMNCINRINEILPSGSFDFLYLSDGGRCLTDWCNQLTAFAQFPLSFSHLNRIYADGGISIWRQLPE